MARKLILVLALAGLAAPATAAADTTVRVGDYGVRVTGDAAGNQVAAAAAAGTGSYSVTVTDAVAAVVPGTGCQAVDAHTAVCTASSAAVIARLGGGDDAITTGAGDDDLRGGAGADVIRAGAGEDEVAGDAGIDQLFAEDGDDYVRSDETDAVDGGAGNDYLRTSGDETVACGGGARDQVGFKYGVRAGALLEADCERSFSFVPKPMSITPDAIAVRVECSDSYGPCTSTLVLRVDGRRVAARRFRSRGTKSVVVTLPLSEPLAPGTIISLRIHRFHEETAEGADERLVDLPWRVRMS